MKDKVEEYQIDENNKDAGKVDEMIKILKNNIKMNTDKVFFIIFLTKFQGFLNRLRNPRK